MKILLIVFLLSGCSYIHIVQDEGRPKIIVDSPWEECKIKTKRKAVILKCKYKF